jgi:hypothetical protein
MYYTKKIDPIIYNSDIEAQHDFCQLALAAIDQAGCDLKTTKKIHSILEESLNIKIEDFS